MFARNVSLHLKPNSVGEFSRIIDKEIIPLLRKQKGFQDEIMFIASGGLEAVGISLWEEKEHAEAYAHKTYPEVMRTLAKVVDGTPQVQTYEVSNSTFHKIEVPVTA
ncbi:MAG: hypothetical protein A3H94_06815 [Acidobacteria bacterium RIFCSPLOWO2_02_FULL_60_20]|nr:MAG: hypothetical protein A3H94_06815 [Acidobacteria bacterium RIFCSPLOWO2_02_FULL_60_20]